MKWLALIAFSILLLLNIFDGYSTIVLMERGFTEANPFMDWIMSYFGVTKAIVLTKGLFFSVLAWVSYKICIRKKTTVREKVFLISAYTITISYYSYFMYTKNFQYMLLIN